MNRTKLIGIIAQIPQIIIANCETDKEVQQVKEGIEKYIDFFKSIPQTWFLPTAYRYCQIPLGNL